MTDVSQTEQEVTRKQVAKHFLLDASANVVEDEEQAEGYRYTLLANDQSFDWLWANANDGERKMLAIFGAKTLATNETSQARNNVKGEATADEQMTALRERFELLRSGKWVDRSGGGVGARVDKDALATAIVDVAMEKGQVTEANKGTVYAAIRAKLEDAAFVRQARNTDGVNARYAAIVGKPTKSVEDLLAGVA